MALAPLFRELGLCIKAISARNRLSTKKKRGLRELRNLQSSISYDNKAKDLIREGSSSTWFLLDWFFCNVLLESFFFFWFFGQAAFVLNHLLVVLHLFIFFISFLVVFAPSCLGFFCYLCCFSYCSLWIISFITKMFLIQKINITSIRAVEQWRKPCLWTHPFAFDLIPCSGTLLFLCGIDKLFVLYLGKKGKIEANSEGLLSLVSDNIAQ